MTLENIYYIGQTIAVLAVVGSLIFVGVQLRQNTIAQRQNAQDAFNIMKFDHMSLLISNPDVADIHRRGLKDLSKLDDIERWRFGAIMQQVFDMALSLYRQPDAFEEGNLNRIMIAIRQPGATEWWSSGREIYPPDFQIEMDKMIKEMQRE